MINFLHKLFFSLVILVLPINLGLHFFSTDAFVNARLVDYLVPTIWLQDILVALVLLFWVLDCGFQKFYNQKAVRFVLLFLFSLLPSFFIAPNIKAAFSFGAHTFLYGLFGLYVYSYTFGISNFKKILKLLSLGIFVLFLFAVGQWNKQSAIFDNYLFLGEQPYDSSTFGVARTDFFGALKIPSYGTFRHPNIFGGYLSVILFWFYGFLVVIEKNKKFKLIFLLGFISLFLTFSLTSMLALLLAILFLKLIRNYGKSGVLASMFITFMIFVSSLFIPLLSINTDLGDDPSFYRRSNLLKSSFNMLEDYPLFGSGLNNFTVRLGDYLPRTQILSFNQPVHNIFVLILSESGIFAFLLFASIIFLAIQGTLNHSFGLPAILFVSILQLIIIGSFDHFFYTIHQTSILYWLTLGLALTYTKRDVEV